MKNITKLALLLILLLGIVSCELLNVDVQSTVSGTLDVTTQNQTLKGTDDVYPFTGYTTVDPLNDPDVKEYTDKIVAVGIDGVIAVVENVSETGLIFYSGSIFTVSNSNLSTSYVLLEDWPIEIGTTVTLEDLGGFYDDVSEIVMDLELITLSMSGTGSKPGVTVTVRIDVETTITGNPL